MRQKWLHSPRLCRLSWWLKARIKLTNGAGMLLALHPMIAHVAHYYNHRLIAHWAPVIARFCITLFVRLTKLRPYIALNLPHEHIWTLETKALDFLNRTVFAIHGWGKNRTVCAIHGWGNNWTICAIRGRTCLLYNNYTTYSCFLWWYNTIV